MALLTELEFDRRYLIKLTVARTLLKYAATVESPREACEISREAASVLAHLPKKEACRTFCCGDCGGREFVRENEFENFYGRSVFKSSHSFCNKCKREDPTFVERFVVNAHHL